MPTRTADQPIANPRHLPWIQARSASAGSSWSDGTASNTISFARFAMERTGAFGGGELRQPHSHLANTISFARFRNLGCFSNRANEITTGAAARSSCQAHACQDSGSTHSKSGHLPWIQARSASAGSSWSDGTASNTISFARFRNLGCFSNRADEIMTGAAARSSYRTHPCQDTRPTHSKSRK